ncbi:Zn(2)-C6 fungal-type domain-containing protein [Mycena chlorophos]|uniref:Zn(2)-C6 fungal-type domain-containing protein n=1 Tax=Mycena chlorophos TaxID=658473 RepID=A0A8H6TI19_MYCCL|nr:Zn(2)-C6 fungal-type domain-containing protein [Mycena chlorophos]
MDETQSTTPAAGPSSAQQPPRKSQVTSCAECRRLKLRCDRVFPCASCIRRGCANLCPSGTLEKGKRGFLKRLEQSLPSAKPGSDQEHSEVAMFVARDTAMLKRIQDLEHALAAAGVAIPGNAPPTANEAGASGETRAKRPRTLSNADAPPTYLGPVDAVDVTLGFGYLTIDGEKRSRYVGTSGGAAYLDLWKGQNHSRASSEENSGSPASRALTDRSASPQQMAVLSKMNYLPAYEEAIRIARIYFANASFMYEIIPETIFFNTHLPNIYPDRGRPYIPTNLHILSLFGMVLAVGTFFDLSHPPEVVRPIAARFYDLALAAFNITIPLKLDTIPSVQTLHLMALYFLSTQGESGGDAAWQLLGMAMRSIQAQGCHRDGSRWGLLPQDLEERRRVFWETTLYDRIQSFTFGRPYSQSDAHHDCEMPQTCDTPLPSDNDPANTTFSHQRWHTYKFRFARVLGRITDLVFSAKGPTYSVILDLDREINETYASWPSWMHSDAVKNPIKELPAHALAGDADLRRNSQIASLTNMCFLTLLHLHRGPFCRALMLGPKTLATSKYKTSIESLIGAARAIIDNARGLFALHPALLSRMWYFIFHSFTATVCLAVFVIVAPTHPLAPATFESVQAAIELFDRASGERARDAAERTKSLAARARAEMEAAAANAIPGARDTKKPPPNPALARMEFPTSNMRGNPEDLLGSSTKLIRAQEPIGGGDDASPSPNLPPAAPITLHQPDPAHPSPRQFVFEQAEAVYSPPVSQERWHMQPQQQPQQQEYYAPNYAPMQASPSSHRPPSHNMHHVGPSPVHMPMQAHYPQQQQHQQQQQQIFPPYISTADFDVSAFIQSGAQSWMMYEHRVPQPEGEMDAWRAAGGRG